MGLARSVSPGGRVAAVDANARQVELAQQELHEISNVEFRVASVYQLPFEDHSFDAVFSHALFEHLADPVAAAREVLRVLKPGGIAGIRSPDWTGKLAGPPSDGVELALRYYGELQAANGGDLSIGRKLGSILREAGFRAIRCTASYECYTPVSVIGEYLARQMESSELPAANGLAGKELASRLREWCCRPDAFFAQAWCEVLGEKEK